MSKFFELKDENGKIIPKNIFWLAFFGVLLVCVLYVVVMFFIPVKVSINMEHRGAFGDMFGALGALFSGLAFAGLIVTMLQQREDLQNQKDEIVLQREEIGLQRKDLEAQTEALKLQKEEIAQTNKELQLQRAELTEQNKTIMLQRFENSFFNMLNIQQSILGNIEAVDNSTGEVFRGRDAMFRILFVTKRRIINKDDYGIKNVLLSFNVVSFDDGRIEPYFQQIYYILDYVDQARLLTIQEKYNYICMMRTTFSSNELTLIFYYCLSKYGDARYKQLIEKYALFKYLRKDSLFSEDQYSLYGGGAYEFIQ